MSEEPRRSGRATKGQHKVTSSSPAPVPKRQKKSKKSNVAKNDSQEDEGDWIRCICGDDDPSKKCPYIACDACGAWQHNICMGFSDKDDDQPDHYFCEECRPEEHGETLQSLANGDEPPIWEVRNKIYANEKKMSKQRKGGKDVQPGWLKKDVSASPIEETQGGMDIDAKIVKKEGAVGDGGQDSSVKRKRDSVGEDGDQSKDDNEQKPSVRPQRRDKRRKPSAIAVNAGTNAEDANTAIVDIANLPVDRQKVALALANIIAEDITHRAQEGFHIPDGNTAKSLGEHHATRIEYALHMNHGEPKEVKYAMQFRSLNANLKRNTVLLERLLAGSLTADELSIMPSSDMASEELMLERAAMKAENDRQAIRITEDGGPRMRRTHKGDELVEDENKQYNNDGMAAAQPVRDRHYSVAEEGGGDAVSPIASASSPQQQNRRLSIDTTKRPSEPSRSASGAFNMDNIWAKTGAGSPTQQSVSKEVPVPSRRHSSIQHQRTDNNAVHHDADIDRMLQNNEDDEYNPEDVYEHGIVWRGKLSQNSAGEHEPTVNARFIAGRDLAPTISWRQALPSQLTIDGRLQIQKAEEYLCGLQWSSSSDVSVLAFTPYDDRTGFDAVFEYFKTRGRYAVVNRDKPALCKDFYIIPVEKGGNLPEHVGMLERCEIKQPVDDRLLLATLVVQRAPLSPPAAQGTSSHQPGANGHTNLSQLRQGMNAPAGSPLNPHSTFSPIAGASSAGHSVPAAHSPIPPNPYGTHTPPHTAGQYNSHATNDAQTHVGKHHFHFTPAMNPMAAEILGPFLNTPTAQTVLESDPNIAREKLEHLKQIMEEDPSTMTDVGKLADRLTAKV